MFGLFAQGNNAVDNTVEAVSTSRDALVSAFTKMWEQTALLAPKIVAMVVVLVLGYLVARIVARVAMVLSEKLGLQTAAARSGLADSMQHMGIKRNLPTIVATIVFWLLMCVFIMAAFNILDMPDVSAAMSGVVSFIPKLLVATIVVVVGLLVASFLRGVVATSADRVGLSYAEHLATAFYYVLVLVTFHAALYAPGHEPAALGEHVADRVRRNGRGLCPGVRFRRPRRRRRHPGRILHPPASAGGRPCDRWRAGRHRP